MKLFFSFVAFIVLISGCSTLEVNVDYDASYDFTKVKKVAVVHEYEVSENSLLNDRIVNALIKDLDSKNYRNVHSTEADLIFVFYTQAKDKTQINTDYMSMGRRYRFGGMMATTSTYDYTEGTLVVDALNPQTKKIVWRAIGTKELNQNKTPQEKTQAINKAIVKIMEKFPKQKL